jgi:hypothetical protein
MGAGCAPRQIRPVADIDAAPLLETLNSRRKAFERGLSGTLDLTFQDGEDRFGSRAYIVAYPDGPFRLEVPAPLGGTALVMTSDNSEILAFYPGKGKAFRSAVDGVSMTPHIPFGLPLDPSMLPSLIMGVFPGGGPPVSPRAYLMDSGQMLLQVGWEDNDLQYTYLFDGGPDFRLRSITIRGQGLEVLLKTFQGSDDLPLDFTITLADGALKGQWDSVSAFSGRETDLDLRLPDGVPVTDLEASP